MKNVSVWVAAEQEVDSRPPMDREASKGQEGYKNTETDCCRERDEDAGGRVKGRSGCRY